MAEEIIEIKTRVDLERCFPIIKELRPHLSLDEYLKIYFEAHSADGYELVAIEENKEIVAVMGYRYLTDFVRGLHLYVDDLVTTEKARSRGYGAKLLQVAEAIAAENQIPSLRLCAVLENHRGISFYEQNGWSKRAYAFTRSVPPVE
jgi:ribosomal protein S18 acetylase RimI-like enzyme